MGSELSIHEVIQNQASANEMRIAAYLSHGTGLMSAEELVRDVLDPEQPVIGTLTLMTDGEWIWPADLAHYVGKYHVKIHDGLLQHMEDNGWECPKPTLAELAAMQRSIMGNPAGTISTNRGGPSGHVSFCV